MDFLEMSGVFLAIKSGQNDVKRLDDVGEQCTNDCTSRLPAGASGSEIAMYASKCLGSSAYSKKSKGASSCLGYPIDSRY